MNLFLFYSKTKSTDCKVRLPPLPSHPSVTSTASPHHSSNASTRGVASNGNEIHDPPSTRPAAGTQDGNTASLGNGRQKLPPIPAATPITRATSANSQEKDGRDVKSSAPMDRTEPDGFGPPCSPKKPQAGDAATIVSPPIKVPYRSRPHRSSTFKATPLGYKPYFILPSPSHTSAQPGGEGAATKLFSEDEDINNLRLPSAREDEEEGTRVTFNKDPILDLSITSTGRNSVEPEASAMRDQDINTKHMDSIKVDEEPENVEGQSTPADEEKLLNQVERFERLMKVLTLLRGSGGMEAFLAEGDEGAGSDSVARGRMEELREHIKLALDEAVQLRLETTAQATAMQSRAQVSK